MTLKRLSVGVCQMLAVSSGLLGSLSYAQTSDILIGMSLPLSGFNAAAGQEGLTTAKAAVKALNAAGGIQGRQVTIVALDDEFKPAKAAENAKALAEQGVIAMFNCWGTASCSAMMPVIQEKQLPLVAGIAGGGPMRTDPGRFAFNVRPTTADEISRMVKQMTTVGQDKIALIYQDDAFGKSGQAASKAVFERFKLAPVVEIAVAADGSSSAAATKQLQQSGANGVVLVASPRATTALITQARKEGLYTQFYNLAAQANRKLVADLGTYTRGVVFTTLVPNPWKASIPVVRDYQQAIVAATGKDEFSYLGLEVFINAQVLFDGLKQAGPKVTRQSLVAGLEAMGEKRYGSELRIKYGSNDRNGSEYVGLTIIGSQGRFVE